ncbi:hypothetical protein MB27_31955, partial [Actinoplanes utahensis]
MSSRAAGSTQAYVTSANNAAVGDSRPGRRHRRRRGFSAPVPDDRLTRLERQISDTMRRSGHDREVLDRVLSRSGTDLDPAQAWAMGQTHLHTIARGRAELPVIARQHRMPPEVIEPAFTALCEA